MSFICVNKLNEDITKHSENYEGILKATVNILLIEQLL